MKSSDYSLPLPNISGIGPELVDVVLQWGATRYKLLFVGGNHLPKEIERKFSTTIWNDDGEPEPDFDVWGYAEHEIYWLAHKGLLVYGSSTTH